MKIAVINETSAADKNAAVLAALEGRSHTVINAGMTKSGAPPELTYIHTGLLTALLLNLKRADLVVGGCGTGQGFLNSAMQYPNVFCGLIQNPLDAWLFAQINGGNCISLALNFGYGWAGEINLKFIFDRLFACQPFGQGYPPHRRETQHNSRQLLTRVSRTSHKTFAEIITALPDEVLLPVLNYPHVLELLDLDSIDDQPLKQALTRRVSA